MRKLLLLLLVGLFTLFIAACGGGGTSDSSSESGEQDAGDATDGETAETNEDEVIKIKMAHVSPEDSTEHYVDAKFKEVIEEKSNGRFQVDIFPNSELGGEREIIESLQTGSLQISAPAVGSYGNFLPELQVFDFPFLFSDTQTAYDVLDSDIGKGLLENLQDHNMVGLGYAENGWRHLTTPEGPVTSPDQVKGLKIRVVEIPMHLEFWKALGANPTPLAFSELYSALQQGVVDAQENPFYIIDVMNFYEVNPYVTTTGHIYDPMVYSANKEWFESLSEDDQQLVRDSIQEAIDFQRDYNSNLDETLRGELETEGTTITDLTDEQREEWIEKIIPVYLEHADEVGRETLESVLEAAGNDRILEELRK